MSKVEYKEIEVIIVKFLNKEANHNELIELDRWLKKDQNIIIFNFFVKTHFLTTMSMDKFDIEKAKKSIKGKVKESQRKIFVRKIYKHTAAAAVLAVVLIGSYFFKGYLFNNTIENNQQVIVKQSISPGTDKATLTLGDGSEVALVKGTTYTIDNVESNGEELVYTSKEQSSKKVAFNTLTIPRGGQFFIKLADGTKVWLNSESKLTYPINFVKGKTREVELVYGEAYFDVSSSTQHNGAKFKVSIRGQEIEVLGTEFNVKAYQEESTIYTTLVEGKVLLNTADVKEVLEPNQQSVFNSITNNFIIREVEVYYETSWKKGLFGFKKKSLKEIMKVLSRWYDVTVTFENKKLEDVKFKGVLNKNQTIEDILSQIKTTNYINAYEVNNNHIIIK